MGSSYLQLLPISPGNSPNTSQPNPGPRGDGTPCSSPRLAYRVTGDALGLITSFEESHYHLIQKEAPQSNSIYTQLQHNLRLYATT